MPGVFAAGDVRLDSMKRVASAVGEGAMAGLPRPPLPRDDVDGPREPAGPAAPSTGSTTTSWRAPRGGHRAVGQRRARCSSTRATWPTYLVGPPRRVDHAASASVGTEDTVMGMTTPASGPAASPPGTSTAPTSPRVGRRRRADLRLSGGAARLVRAVVPVRPALHRRPGQHGAAHRGDRPAARGPRGARHAVGGAGPRAQQPRLRRHPRGGRAAGRPRSRAYEALPGSRRAGSPRTQFGALDAAAARVRPHRRPSTGSTWPTARRSSSEWLDDHGVDARTGCSAPSSPPRAPTSPGASELPTPLPGALLARAVEWVAAVGR